MLPGALAPPNDAGTGGTQYGRGGYGAPNDDGGPCCNGISQPLGPQSLPAPPAVRSYVPAPPSYNGR